MLHEKLLETIISHSNIIDEAVKRGIDWSDTLQLYAVIHTLQIHAQAVIDYILHTCSILGVGVETPILCIAELRRRGLVSSEEEELLKRLVRFRNIVVHGYTTVDVNRVKAIVESKGYWSATRIVSKIQAELEKRNLLDP